ncbi:IclR family transcriptional regulator [Microbacterium sp. Marseille-Q6965]|uniref:IclR family transcriptional regulator n=1 Tax=Microbacterium sp. Marseille-Q6965 TaxID=2965072 RepID=UPI0021B82D44|nr:IclR family transcriptional regulator [Microbacterium sp. Marseille-Q6965]
MGDSTADGLLERTLRVLGCFSEDEPELGATRLAERTGLSPSTLHRLLARMVELGLLTRVPGRRYAVGRRLFELGELSPLALRLRETALPHMLRIYEATGENVHLAVLDAPSPGEASALFVGRVTGHGSVPTLSRMGGRLALHAVGVGKALLALQSDDWIREYCAHGLERETVHTITEETALLADVEATRARGYAYAREEMTLGNVSIAAALGSVPGLPRAAVGVVSHIDRADERRLAGLVRQAASELSRALRA